MYKSSQFNFIFDSTDKKVLFLYNAKTGAFATVPQALKIEIQETIENPNDNAEQEKPIRKELIDGGFIVRDTVNEFEEIKKAFFSYKKNNDIMILTLLAAETCNFNCPYCFTFNSRGMVMKEWVYEAILNYTKRSMTNNFQLKVNFFGGEPTLSHKNITTFMEKLNAIATENKFRSLGYAMVTNGYLLSKDKLSHYFTYGLNNFQITLDGDKEFHDKSRYLKSGKGTFDKIWNNLLEIKKLKGNFSISVRSNFLKYHDETIEEFINKFHRDFGDDKRFHLYFRPVYNFETTRQKEKDLMNNIYSLEEGMKKQITYNLLVAKRAGHVNNEERFSNPIPHPIPSWCDTEKENFWVFGADGLLFKCDSLIGREDEACGRIEKDGTIKTFPRLQKWLKTVYDDPFVPCITCKLLPLCQGGCLRNRKNGYDCYLTENTLRDNLEKTYTYYQSLNNSNVHI